MCWLNKPYRLWSYIVCEFLLTAVKRLFCLFELFSHWSCSGLHNATLNDFVLSEISWFSHSAASFLHSSVLSINPAVISSPKKLFPTFQSIFCKTEWQENSALCVQLCRERTDFLIIWSTVLISNTGQLWKAVSEDCRE